MRRVLLALFLLPFTFMPVAAANDSWAGTIEKLKKALVYIESENGGCSGFVVDAARKYVQTAAHCADKELWVDRVSAITISKDSQEDLMILEVKDLDPSRETLRLAAEDPEIGLEVMSAGYGYALKRPFFRKAMVSDNGVMIPEIGGPFIGVDSGFIGGQSGGPVVNINGEVVAIVQRASDKLGIGVSASVMRERMGRFWAQK